MNRPARALELFEEAVELEPAERAGFLADSCAGDPELRRAVERLLAADSRNDGFLDAPLVELGEGHAGTPAGAPMPRQRLGGYQLLGRIGEGGTSTVYLARRADPPGAERVAIKLLANDDPRVGEEARFLGRLRHPAIANLLEVGCGDDGRPFLVMEHVPGLPIDQHCDRHELTIDARIEIFLAVCEGVAAAHRSLVLHRDLKPGNILVGADGRPKLVDFGLARHLDPRGKADPTDAALRFLTLNYASPEHLLGEPLTTASDTYSLGVVLYQLVSGARPYDWKGRSLLDLTQRLATIEVLPPSQAIGDDEAGQHAAADRATTPVALRARLAGDLDRIVMKALAVDPARRYESPAALAADLRRERDGLPILARPASLGYRCERFLRRHRWAAAQVLAAGLMLIGAAVIGWLHAGRVAVERDVARAAQTRAGRVIDFLVNTWTPVDPLQGGRLDDAGRELLTAAVRRMDAVDDPALRADLRHALGTILSHVGELDRAAAVLGQALEERRRQPDPGPGLESELELAWVERLQGSLDAAEGHARAVLELSAGPERRDLHARASSILGEILSAGGRHAEAEQHSRRAVAVHRELFGERHPEVANDLNNLSMLLYRAGQTVAAAEAARRCLEVSRTLPQVSPAEIANVAHNLGVIVMSAGDLDASQRHLEEARAIREAAFGADHPVVANSLNSLALLAAERGDLATAERQMRRALQINRAALGSDHESALANQANLVEILDLSGQVEAAVALALETVERSRRHLPPGSPHLLYALAAAGSALLDAGRTDAAGALLAEAVEARRKTLPPGSPDRLLSEFALARWQVASGAAQSAAATLGSLQGEVDHAFGAASWQAGWARALLADARLVAGAPEALAAAREGHRLLAVRLPAGNFRLEVATSVLGAAQVASGDAGGLELLASARMALEKARGPRALSVQQARARAERALGTRRQAVTDSDGAAPSRSRRLR